MVSLENICTCSGKKYFQVKAVHRFQVLSRGAKMTIQENCWNYNYLQHGHTVYLPKYKDVFVQSWERHFVFRRFWIWCYKDITLWGLLVRNNEVGNYQSKTSTDFAFFALCLLAKSKREFEAQLKTAGKHCCSLVKGCKSAPTLEIYRLNCKGNQKGCLGKALNAAQIEVKNRSGAREGVK